MPYSTDVLPGAPIVLHRLEPGPNMVAEMPAAMQEVTGVINDQPHPVYLILDLRALSMGVEDMMKASSDAARGPGALMHHPNIIETLFVMGSSFMKLGVMGMKSDIFGNVKLRTFDTVDQALEYCHQRIAEEAQS